MTVSQWIGCGFLVAWSAVASAPGQKPPVPVQGAPATVRLLGPSGAPATAVVVPQEPVKAAAGAKAPVPQDPAAAAAAAEQQQGAQRLNKIKTVMLDRRVSVMLAEWSKPAGGEANEEGEDESDENEPPTVPPGTPVPAPDPFDEQLKAFQVAFTTGDWGAVKEFLASLDEKLAKAGYERLLQAAAAVPAATNSVPPPVRPYAERNVFTFDDIMALAAAAPHERSREDLASLGAVLRQSLTAGDLREAFLERARQELAKPQEEQALHRRELVRVLYAAGLTIEAGEFLPDLADAEQRADHDALNLLATHYLALYQKDAKIVDLENAWRATQAVFASGEITKHAKEEALKTAVELAPRIREELGHKWLTESFTTQPERGMEIISAIGAAASLGIQKQPARPDLRLNGLKLQATAVDALLEAAPERANEWREPVHMLALNWLREAELANTLDRSRSSGPMMRRDNFGNMYYVNGNQNTNQGNVRPITSGELLEIKPGDRWLGLVHDSVRPTFAEVFARLYLKVNDEEQAFPFIEQLAENHPDRAKNLADEFVRVWTNNHDPNASRNRTNYYMFMYGFEQRAQGIPLTRSKQQRNLRDLAKWISKLRTLGVDGPDERLLVRAFTTAHSTAEVYRLEDIAEVFGSVEAVKPATMAELLQKMRSNLAGVWRKPATQEKQKTRRRQKDIEAEVLRGYASARAVTERALQLHSGNWTLELARAAIDHDENNYRQQLAQSAEYSKRRQAALEEFERAAADYAKGVAELSQAEQTTRAYELWYYASLGACDLGAVSHETLPDLRQPQRIREAILALPGEAAERHMAMFANTLFTRLSSVNPAVKDRYLRGGFEIVGDHEQAREARKVFDYYNDLVSEIKLESVIDGSDVVGEQPFGVFVNLRHTREIERESGGFGRYLQNQNTSRSFSYNYGRPLENYRDKFQEAAVAALGEHFNVLSVTFQSEDVHSRATAEYGWRVTPYAYLLLEARSPAVDKIPPLRLDLDFLDTSGYVVLPIASATVPIDASAAAAPRPMANLEITQTLDERQAQDGKLLLEIRAQADGLVAPLAQILELKPEEFDVVSTEDQGLSVSRFDPESEDSAVISERGWMVALHAKENLTASPSKFSFAAPIVEAETVYQRYVDADLLTTEREISLEESYGDPGVPWLWPAIAIVLLALGTGFLVFRFRRPREVSSEGGLRVPDQVTAFTVLGLLRDIDQNNGLNAASRLELHTEISGLEQFYFGGKGDAEPDLRGLAERWVSRATPS